MPRDASSQGKASGSRSRPQTMCSLLDARYQLIGPALIALSCLFPIIFFSPLITTKWAFFFRNDISLARVAHDLFYQDGWLFLVVVVFGMIFPAGKMIVTIFCWYFIDVAFVDRLGSTLSILGKLSMLDIMLFSVFIVAYKGIGFGDVQIRYGLYIYLLVIVGSFLVNLVMAGAAKSLKAARSPGS